MLPFLPNQSSRLTLVFMKWLVIAVGVEAAVMEGVEAVEEAEVEVDSRAPTLHPWAVIVAGNCAHA